MSGVGGACRLGQISAISTNVSKKPTSIQPRATFHEALLPHASHRFAFMVASLQEMSDDVRYSVRYRQKMSIAIANMFAN